MLHIDLKEADRHSEDRLVRILLDVVKDVLNRSWYDTKLVLRTVRLSLVKSGLRS